MQKSKVQALLKQYTLNKSYLTNTEWQALKELADNRASLNSDLLAFVSQYAIAPTSDFNVAALAFESIDSGGRVFFGSNLEFKKGALSLVVHAEQSAIHNAYINGAKKIEELVINAAPCGYCRQFINEITEEKQPLITINERTKVISDLLPEAFGPTDLGNDLALFSQSQKEITDLSDAFNASYAPYSNNKAGCRISTKTGKQYLGVYIENCAYSPSLSPLQAALNQMQLHNVKCDFEEIEDVVLMQSKQYGNQHGVTELVANLLKREIQIISID